MFPGDGPLPAVAAASAAALGRLAVSVASEGDAAPQAVDRDDNVSSVYVKVLFEMFQISES